MEGMTPPTDLTTIPGLIGAWESGLLAVADLCDGLDDRQWGAATPCAGWTVGDVVAHLIDVEDLVGGEPRPEHEPDWAALPHAVGPMGKANEIGVDLRRGRPRTDVLAELRAVIVRRRAQLEETPHDEQVASVFGTSMSLERVVRMRTFDIWVHEQDIRSAIGSDGAWDSPSARVALAQMTRALPYVWGRTVKAPEGSVLRLIVTGPGLEAAEAVVIDADGRGAPTSTDEPPTVELIASWPTVMRLMCGRANGADDIRERITLTGDPDLALRLLPALVIAP